MDKPKRPRKGASFGEVERYNDALAFWKSQQPTRSGAASRVIASAGIVGSVYGAAVTPAQVDTGTTNQWQQSEQRRQQDRRTQDLDEATRGDGYAAEWPTRDY